MTTTTNPIPTKQDQTLEDVRPVRCHFCESQMYYVNDPRHVPEVRVEVYEGTDRTFNMFYAHAECWNTHAAGPRGDVADVLEVLAGRHHAQHHKQFGVETCPAWPCDVLRAAAPASPTGAESVRDLPNAPETDPNRKCWASTINEVCIDPRGCDDRGCQLYADKDYEGRNTSTNKGLRDRLIAAHDAIPRRH